MGERAMNFGPLADLETLSLLMEDLGGVLESMSGSLSEMKGSVDQRKARNEELRVDSLQCKEICKTQWAICSAVCWE